jgi:hypothetical protein
MDTSAQIEKFLRDIRRRNRREIILGILTIPVIIGMMYIFNRFNDGGYPGLLTNLGFLLTIAAVLFNIFVMWRVSPPGGDLSSHPPSNLDYWADEMLRQAKLLRLVPIWGLAPFIPGLVLLLWPKDQVDMQDAVVYSITISLCVVVFAVVAWLNLWGSKNLERQARALEVGVIEGG